MFNAEILEKYNTLPSTKQKDIEKIIITFYESEKQKKLRNEIELRRQEIKSGNKISSEDFWNNIDV